ncbi:class I SAM-dependent DNA methyltransferase [Vibrio quintilis]|uniref:Bifunctional 3-demethylubiquinone-9 3-methyltransferase/ 2-octaprenyl-6-hydroxy phenol methylase n=1 Tax=Vibrio quintilis TaxID=1117707 RepID=A0A1M7YVT0_9VIBR|nr:class I SAM-dependent methyltransferase [Vibrio quintilis]SHO56779.1 bifunctional 3-demethylubiquinone-9 3-methyltransferase/ 2-octaprenyl-6-hydroxy phenol methylase [Vibrio quintilis]
MDNYFDVVARQWEHNPMRLERAQATADQIRQVNFSARKSLVDFGCGTGLLGVQLRGDFQQIHLADSSAEMLKVAQENVSVAGLTDIHTHRISRLTDLPAKYSAITTLMTLHHLADLKQFFTDACQVLEEKGMLMIADLYKEDGSFHDHHPGFDGHHGFDIPVLTAIAEGCGFQVRNAQQYYAVEKENKAGEMVSYPLFFFVAEKI